MKSPLSRLSWAVLGHANSAGIGQIRSIRPLKVSRFYHKLFGLKKTQLENAMPGSERRRELRRRRHRKKKVNQIKRRAEKASASEKEVLVTKLRNLTPGAEEIITALKLVK